MTKSCLYCERKLALKQAVTGELFCSSQHRELYFQAEVAIAFELLTSSDKPSTLAQPTEPKSTPEAGRLVEIPVAKPVRPKRSWVAPGVAACLAVFVLGAIFFGASKKTEWSLLPSATAPLAAADQTAKPAPPPVAAQTQASALPEPLPLAKAVPLPNAASESGVQHAASITVKETSWVAVCSDGAEVFGTMLSPGDERKIEFSGRAVVRTGNAGGIAIALDGKSVGSVGPPGGLRVIELNPQVNPHGFHLLSLKPGENGACVSKLDPAVTPAPPVVPIVPRTRPLASHAA
jgi:hypothetical protein